jgi:hypothetical protein
MYHVQEHLQPKALDNNKVNVEHCAQVFYKVLVLGEKIMRFDLSISGPVQAKIHPASFSIVPLFVPHTIPNFTSIHIAKLEHVGGWTHTIYQFFAPLCEEGTPKLINDIH